MGSLKREWIGYFCLGLIILSLGGWLRTVIIPEWWGPDLVHQPPVYHPWVIEADCYSQLARVQRVMRGGPLDETRISVENWPTGLIPSTTAIFDLCILLLVPFCWPFTAYPLAWAGAIVSPLLWIVLSLIVARYSGLSLRRSGQLFFLIGLATLPDLVYATPFGRPRHQSLILVFLTLGLLAEYARWKPDSTRTQHWNVAGGIIWALALWTSLYEPLLVLLVLIAFNLVARGREQGLFLIALGYTLLVALALEGVHVFVPSAAEQPFLARWLQNIVEIQPLNFAAFINHITLLALFLPVAAWRLWPREGGERADAFLILLTALLAFLAFYQSRWIYYLNLTMLLLLARYFQLAPLRWNRVLLVFLALIGIGYGDQQRLALAAEMLPNQPSPQIEYIARNIDAPGGILGPWWLSPGLLYFSKQPIVTGSSHCGIEGIVAGARFFATRSWTEAEAILQARRVRWIVVYDEPLLVYPLLNNCRQTLGLPALADSSEDKAKAEQTVAQVLIEGKLVPTWLRLRAVSPNLKLYEYTPAPSLIH